MGTCDPGLRAQRKLVVTEEQSARAMGSGDVPVLATPALLALAEAACVEAIAGDLPAGLTTIGAYAEIEHERPSPVGSVVEAEATLIGHHGRRLEFDVLVRQHGEVLAHVRHRRVLVDQDRFLAKLG